MTERSRTQGSSPLATVEEIQRRLVRPSSLNLSASTSTTRSRDDVRSLGSSQFKVNLTELQRNQQEDIAREMTKKKLEDYLDPDLLSAISSKIGGSKRKDVEMKPKNDLDLFEWPVDDLRVFAEGSRTEKRMKWRSNDTIDLNDDLDLNEGDVGDEDDESDSYCTPFRRFERTASKRFKR